MKTTNILLNSFSVDIYSQLEEQRYVGSFVSKKLSIKDLAQLRVRTAQLCGGLKYDPDSPGQGLDLDTYNLNSMIAHLEIAIVEAPDWWNLDKIVDLNVMSAVHKEVVDFENNFPRRGSVGSSQEGSSKKAAETNDRGVTEPMVVGEVQASLEP